MVAAVVQSVKTVGNGTATGATITIALTGVGSGNTLVLVYGGDSGDTPTFNDSTGNSWGTWKLTYQGSGTSVRNYIWVLDNATAGTHTITFSTTGITFYNAKILVEVSGTANPSYDATSVATNTATLPTGTVTSGTLAQADNVVFTVMSPHTAGVTTNTVTSGWTIQQDEPDNNNYYGTTVATFVSSATTAKAANWICVGGSGGANAMAMEIFAIKASAGGGTSLTPGAGAVTFSGPVPTVARTANQALTPGQAALAFTGPVATVARTANQALTPGVGAITFSSPIPTVAQSSNQSVTPGVGALAFTGYAALISQGTTVAPGAGAVVFTGYAPTVAQPQALTPGVGSVTFTGFAPSVAQPHGVLPGAGSVALAGFAPTVTQASASTTLGPDAGAVVITGYAPTVARSGSSAGIQGGFDVDVGKPRRYVSKKPLLQRVLEARYPKVKPKKERAARYAKAIEVEAARLVVDDGSQARFDALMRQWKAQGPVLPAQAPAVDLQAVFMAQVAFRIRQLDLLAKQAEADDEEAIALLMA